MLRKAYHADSRVLALRLSGSFGGGHTTRSPVNEPQQIDPRHSSIGRQTMSTPPATVPIPQPPPPPPPPPNEKMFFGPDTRIWRKFISRNPSGTDGTNERKLEEEAKSAGDDLKNLLLASLQMQHVVVLAGSGTSLAGRGQSLDSPPHRMIAKTGCVG